MNLSRVAQRKRAGPITQRSVDRNHPLLHKTPYWLDRFHYLKLRHLTWPIFMFDSPTDSSVGRAGDCSWLLVAGISRSLVQIRLGGLFSTVRYLMLISVNLLQVFENPCQKWDSNPRPHTWTRMLLCSQRKRPYSWVWRLRPLGHPDIPDVEIEHG